MLYKLSSALGLKVMFKELWLESKFLNRELRPLVQQQPKLHQSLVELKILYSVNEFYNLDLHMAFKECL